MMSRFSKSTFSEVSRALVLTGLALLAAASTSLRAQQPGYTATPTATPKATPKPQAYVRFWNMLAGQNAPSLELLVAENRSLASATPGNYYASYVAVDPATYNFTVRRSNDPNGVLKRLPTVLRADVYITFLAALDKDGKPDVQLLDDTVDPKTDDGLGKLVVRHFFPGATLTVGIGSAPAGAPLAFGDSTTLEHLPIRNTLANLQAAGLGPTAKSWSVEVDFATGGHHATLLVIPDPYGRFRPRLVFDGSVRKPPAAPPATSPAAPAIPRPST